MRNRRIKAFIAALAAAAIISGCGKEAPSTVGAQSGNKVSRFFNPLYFNGYLLDPSGRSNGPADWSKAGGESAAAGAGENEESGTAGTAAEKVDEADYEKGYEKGLADALNVVNKNSASYLKGLEAGKQEVSSTVDINSASYKSGYDAGMKYVHDTKVLDPDDPNYKAGYDDGYKDGTKDGNTTVQPGSDEYNVIYEKGVKDGIKQGETKKSTTTVTNSDSYKKGYEDGLKAAAGKSDSSSQSYKDGYKKGQEDADNRTNPDSENYKSGQESVTLSIEADDDTVTATASNGKALSAKVDAASILKTDLTGTSGSQDGDFSLNAGEYATVLPGWVSGKRVIQASTLSSQTQGTALAKDVLDGKTVWVGGIQLTGSMPDYPAIDETSGAKTTADWAASGLSKDNSTGIITISDGYHKESKIIGASGEASDDQVLTGVSYSSKTGAHTGAMPYATVTVYNEDGTKSE